MDLLIKYLIVAVSAALFAVGPMWMHVLCLSLFITAASVVNKHKIGLCCTYYVIAVLPLVLAALHYSSSISYALSSYALVVIINSVVLSVALISSTNVRPLTVATALVLLSIPPLASVSLVSPLPVAGVLFPGTGTVGLVLFITLCSICALGTRAMLIGMGVIALTTTQTHAAPVPAHAMVGVDTVRGMPTDINAAVFTQLHRHEELEAAQASNARAVVFPESTFGQWHPSYSDVFALTDQLILGGARHYLNEHEYVNVLINGATGELVYAQEYPIAMQVPGTARAVSGRTLRTTDNFPVLICSEITHPWKAFKTFATATNQPVIWVANVGWTDNPMIIQRIQANVLHWANLYNVPVVQAVNYRA